MIENARQHIIETIEANGCYLIPSGWGNYGTELEEAFNDLLKEEKICPDGTENGFHRFVLK